MLGLALLFLSVNNLKAMEENNNNINCSNKNITYNKLSINKQTDFEINSCNANIINDQQDKIQKLESKIDEIIERQKMLENKFNIDNKILMEEFKKLKQDISVSSAIFGSINNISNNITKNTKQMNNIERSMKDSNKEISNSLDTLMSITTHCATSLINGSIEQTNRIQDNNKMMLYLVNSVNTMYNIVRNNSIMQFMYQNSNCINNILDDNVQENNTEDNKIEDKKVEDKKIEDNKVNNLNTINCNQNNYRRDNNYFFGNK